LAQDWTKSAFVFADKSIVEHREMHASAPMPFEKRYGWQKLIISRRIWYGKNVSRTRRLVCVCIERGGEIVRELLCAKRELRRDDYLSRSIIDIRRNMDYQRLLSNNNNNNNYPTHHREYLIISRLVTHHVASLFFTRAPLSKITRVIVCLKKKKINCVFIIVVEIWRRMILY